MTKKNRHFEEGQRYRTAALIACTGGLSVVVALGWVIRSKNQIEISSSKAVYPALVFGCPPGPALTARTLAAVELVKNGFADRIIVSGRGEATQAYDMLVAHGVDDKRIDVEAKARNTMENLIFSAPLLKGQTFWAVSDRWHLPRIKSIARTLDMDAIPHPVDRVQPMISYAKQLVREGLSVTHRWANPVLSL
ncbi:MAG: YdcF family protein [Myxococcota bacterium]|nr:YdcF family protein [Myxococcota bacterium]